ncbi:hypothetical protein PAL_GLEAN10003686 [Pteropus alecto]|uniref:Uncharacterized protein n=1 Tax=Pteropus alecto TaxID=9402 RepID=L5K839_PTEAL|nr:hypothetical protein PAL_GLEAN10003686 [Pteropus alecto]
MAGGCFPNPPERQPEKEQSSSAGTGRPGLDPNLESSPPFALCIPQGRLQRREAVGGLACGDRKAGLTALNPRK